MHRILLMGVLTFGPAATAAEPDWFLSLYSGDGLELRTDERVFTLFAMLNAAGFDQGAVTRLQPFPKVTYAPARALVREKLAADPAFKKVVDAYFDAHPVSLERYLQAALRVGPPPFGAIAKGREIPELKGFDALMAKAWQTWKLDEIFASVQPEFRKALRTYLTGVDGPITKARAALKLPDSAAEPVLVSNLLDAQDVARGVGFENQAMIAIGPADKAQVDAVVREYARVALEGAVAKKAATWAAGPQVLKEAQAQGATDGSVSDYVGSLVGTAVGLKVTDAPDSAWELAQSRGYFGVREIGKLLDEGKSGETLVAEALSRAEARRPGRK